MDTSMSNIYSVNAQKAHKKRFMCASTVTALSGNRFAFSVTNIHASKIAATADNTEQLSSKLAS